MSIAWLKVIKSVPWADVINSAPQVADGAKKLWSTIVKKHGTHEGPVAANKSNLSADARISELEMNVGLMETTVDELQAQMLTSSELIKKLAEQNTQLIKRIEASRVHFFWLALTTVLAIIAAVASLVLTLASHSV